MQPFILFNLSGGLMPPINVVATVNGSDIDITWTAASGAESYNVYQSIDGGTWTLLDNEATTSYTFTPTTPGEYNFRVTSIRGAVESSPSAETTTTEAMMVQVYSDTITGLLVSAVDGTAFVDAAAAITGYADGNHLIEIEDSAGKIASGVLKTQGSGETLGSELITSVSNGAIWPFETLTVTGKDVDSAINTSDKGSFLSNYNASLIGMLTKQSVTISLNSGLSPSMFTVRHSNGAIGNLISDLSVGANTTYRTFRSDGTSSYNDGGLLIFVSEASNFSAVWSNKQVTAPSTSGATLVDEIAGTTQNFFNVEAGFVFNEASYTCTVKQILPT